MPSKAGLIGWNAFLESRRWGAREMRTDLATLVEVEDSEIQYVDWLVRELRTVPRETHEAMAIALDAASTVFRATHRQRTSNDWAVITDLLDQLFFFVSCEEIQPKRTRTFRMPHPHPGR
jgi:hypothetical protein